MELEDVYDDETLARIDDAGRGRRAPHPAGIPPRPEPGAPSAAQRATAAIAIATATAIGMRDVFEAPERVRLEELDPWADGGSNPRVRFHWHPVPRLSVAEVLW
jgi:hypothetical protein